MYCFQDYKKLYSDITLPATSSFYPSGLGLSFSRQEGRLETKSFVTVSQTAKKYTAGFHKVADYSSPSEELCTEVLTPGSILP